MNGLSFKPGNLGERWHHNQNVSNSSGLGIFLNAFWFYMFPVTVSTNSNGYGCQEGKVNKAIAQWTTGNGGNHGLDSS